MIIDTHAHLNFSEFNKDRDLLIKDLIKKDYQIINVGTNIESSKECVKLAEKYGFYASVGLHPLNIESSLKIKGEAEKKESVFDYNTYKKLSQSKSVVAIGEIGLDYWYKPKGKDRRAEFIEKQKAFFINQIDLAEELNLPLIIHCRMAFNDLIEILSKRNTKGVIHCFTGTVEQAKELLSLGYYIGINGIIFKMDLKDVIQFVPIDKILIETDCPYLSPPDFEERNNPFSLELIAEEIGRIKNISKEEVIIKTADNAKSIFNLLIPPLTLLK
ncbi:MAG: TatD family hydrolase [Candidatus Pacebacteria bacterium]|nr:TatD family hydrolase [Candidatus Paceibacterota bacterium]